MNNPNPYKIFTDLTKAGWKRDFDRSQDGKGLLCIPVSGAPALGGSPAGWLWAGCWTKQDGTSIFMRSNMDRSASTLVLDPLGMLPHSFHHSSMILAADAIDKLNII